MAIFLGAAIYLAIGIAVASIAAKHQFTISFRWWHVLTWPVIVSGWLLVLAVIWGSSNK